MTPPFNSASGSAYVGFQAQNASIGQLTVGPGASREEMYEAGVNNLKSGNAAAAREFIWKAMMRDHMNSEVLFHWLVAMLSGRTVRQFSDEEIGQLRQFRSWCADAEGDPWMDGVQLIYRLLDSVLQPSGPKASVSLLEKQFEGLGEKQRGMLLRLELFLSGPRRDERWRDELQRARSRQHSGGRPDRAWKFFHPDPFKVGIPQPLPEQVTAADLRWMRASAIVFAVLAGYVGLELLTDGAVLGLLGYVVGLAGGIVAAAAYLEPWFQAERPPVPPGNGSAGEYDAQIGELFRKYFRKHVEDNAERKCWWDAAVKARKFYASEIAEICRSNEISVDEVAWLIHYEVCQLHQRWRDGTGQGLRRQTRPRPGAVGACRAALAVFLLGLALAMFATPTHVLDFVAVLASAVWAWLRWLRVNLEHKRFAADKQERDHRQAGIDEEHARWSERLKDRPDDVQMATWLARDRTVLLGRALDYFDLPRSRLIAYGFLENSAVGARRGQVEGGLPRYQRYLVWMFLLAEDGVRQMRVHLDFLTGTTSEREQISYGYGHIAAAHVTRESDGGQTFKLRLVDGDPIKVRLRKADLAPDSTDKRNEKGKDFGEAEEPDDEGTSMDRASVFDTLRILEGVAAEGRNWLREHDWASAWSGDGGA